jgi:flagellar motor switch/type III secretory pathway protein FliN
LKAEIAVRGFTLGDLLSIEAGSLVDSGVSIDADVAIAVNQALIGCAKLDLIGERLAVRVTELT